MNDRVKKMIMPIIISAAIMILLLCIFKKPEKTTDFLSYISYAITGVTAIFLLYERVLWRYIPWNRPPVLKEKYSGTISYIYENKKKTKKIELVVNQSWLSISIKAKTNINSSSSIVGTIVSENDENVLYYNYITNPKVTKENNPIQHGTCRIVLEGNNASIRGKYWTSSKTIGDIELKEVSK